MKRLVLAICLIVATIVIGVVSLFVIDNYEEKMVIKLDNILTYANEENYTKLNEAIKDTYDQWKKEKIILNILIGQQDTNEITADLRMIEFFAKQGNKESVLLYTYECKTALERIKSSNEPSFSTIL